jgi:osmoprotectant transport system permease protein
VSPALEDALRRLPETLGWHVVLSASALLLGLLVSLPLAVAAARSPLVRWPVLAVAGLVQTVPSIALLALFYPLLLALSALSRSLFGIGFQALGFLPSLLALSLYSALPILRNGVAGLLGVDPAVSEAARGVGMSEAQRLVLVEAPLAAPVAMAGIRTAAVWVIGAATLSTSVGQTSLGDYIFSGLQTETWSVVLFGCAASAGLALMADQLLALLEGGLKRRRPRRVVLGLILLVAGVVLAAAPLLRAGPQAPAYVVGAKNFSEQYILADLISARLRAEGARVAERDDLGSVVAFRALAAGDLDVYVDYSGTLWTSVLGRTDTPGRAVLLERLKGELERRYGVLLLGSLGFENAYALAMREDEAARLRISSIADLARAAPSLTFGADLEFLARPEGRRVMAAYGLRFRRERQFQPTFLYRALQDGEADAISAFSSDGRVAADRLRLLSDPLGAIPPYDAVVLVSPRRRHDERLLGALRPLIGKISLERMQKANLSVDRDQDKLGPAAAAQALAATLGGSPRTRR